MAFYYYPIHIVSTERGLPKVRLSDTTNILGPELTIDIDARTKSINSQLHAVHILDMRYYDIILPTTYAYYVNPPDIRVIIGTEGGLTGLPPAFHPLIRTKYVDPPCNARLE